MFRASSAHLQEDTVVHGTVTLYESDSTICCTCTTVSSWRWKLEARNM